MSLPNRWTEVQKRPVKVHAWLWDGDVDWRRAPEEIQKAVAHWSPTGIVIPTLEGDHTTKPGDWIIKGVKGELYPCKPDIFALTYDVASAPPVPLAAAETPALALIEKAIAEVHRLASQYGKGWCMSVPVNKERDSDIILADALEAAQAALRSAAAGQGSREAALEEAAKVADENARQLESSSRIVDRKSQEDCYQRILEAKSIASRIRARKAQI